MTEVARWVELTQEERLALAYWRYLILLDLSPEQTAARLEQANHLDGYLSAAMKFGEEYDRLKTRGEVEMSKLPQTEHADNEPIRIYIEGPITFGEHGGAPYPDYLWRSGVDPKTGEPLPEQKEESL